MLFDLIKDPSETTDIAAAHPDVVVRLTTVLKQYNSTAVSSAGQGKPDDPRADPSLHNGTCVPWVDDK